jgi:hypothetical protein
MGDQTRFPLATLVSEACKRHTPQRIRLLALARRVAAERGLDLGGED